MFNKLVFQFTNLIFLTLIILLFINSAAQAKHHKIAYVPHSYYLAPPPPAYVPAWPPEKGYEKYAPMSGNFYPTPSYPQWYPPRKNVAAALRKDIYAAPGYATIVPVRPNKYVTYWVHI